MRKIITLSLIFVFAASSIVLAYPARLNKGHAIAVSKDAFDRFYQVYLANDDVALQKMTMSGLVRPTIEDEEVDVVNVHPFGGSVEVRPKGEIGIWWTAIEAIKK